MPAFRTVVHPATCVGVAVGGSGVFVAVGGIGVLVGGNGVFVGVFVGGTLVAVGGIGVLVGGTGVFVGGTGVAVGAGNEQITSCGRDDVVPESDERYVTVVVPLLGIRERLRPPFAKYDVTLNSTHPVAVALTLPS